MDGAAYEGPNLDYTCVGPHKETIMDLTYVISQIKLHEGFRANPYPDPLHGWSVPTFGHGLTYITEAESEFIVAQRIANIHRRLDRAIDFYGSAPEHIQHALVEMAYQMGVGGLLKFRNMLGALRAAKYREAYEHALCSRWARQTPNRAKTVAGKLLSA